MKKRILTLILTIAVLSTVFVSTASAAGSATGQQIVECAMQYLGKVPYVWGGENIDGANPGADCSGFICRIYEKFGFNFWKYRTSLRNYGVNLGTNLDVAQLGDIIWYSGHVAIYAGRNNQGDHMIVHETGGSFQNVVYTKAKIVNAELKGVIRIPGIYNNGETITVKKASFTPAVDAEYTSKRFTTETNACVVTQVNKQSGVKVTQMGLYLYDANNNLIKKYIENVSNVSNAQTKYHSWYDIQAELGVTLTPGTLYTYKFFGIFDGEEIAEETVHSFTTAGNPPVPAPESYIIRIAAGPDGQSIWYRDVTVGEPIGGFPAPETPQGYTFKGYFTAPSGGTQVTESTIFNGNSDTIYYAQFEQNVPSTIKVHLNSNGGQCSVNVLNVTPGETIKNLPVPTKKGYTFEGWYTDESLGSKKVGTNTKINVTQDITLYANWVQSEAEYIFPFTDVSKDEWYHNDVKNAHRMGLRNGKSKNRYGADENMTYAEAIKLAACMHQLYTEGRITIESGSGSKWYQPYVEYAQENSIPWSCSNYDAEITRRDYVYIFYYALPESAYNEINDVLSIPDVKISDKFAKEIYKFYRAGILAGNDAKGTFNPTDKIKRSEVATILSRMMDKNARKLITF